MEAVQAANLALRFLLELCALAALAYSGWQVGDGLPTKLLLAIGAPLVAAVVWGMFIAPKAAVQVSWPVSLALQVVIFGTGVAGLVYTGHPVLAGVFATVVILNAILMYIWKQ